MDPSWVPPLYTWTQGSFDPCYPHRFDPLLSSHRFDFCYPAASISATPPLRPLRALAASIPTTPAESSAAVKRNHGTPPFDSCAKMPLPFASSTATADVNPTIASRPLIHSGAGPLNTSTSKNLVLTWSATLKNALSPYKLGGGGGGSNVDPKGKSESEVLFIQVELLSDKCSSLFLNKVTYSLNLDCARRFDPCYPRLFDSVYYSFRRFDPVALCRFDPVDWPQQEAKKTDIDHLWEIGHKPSTGG
uniref:Uncharacterized protein n=1 Tax=Ananas comosus var. bracteatus TaxID=296719 RepID=A0A6V7PFK9_ANACO|nr:unnamed protein product [Ananas comosus var. bracteatus]